MQDKHFPIIALAVIFGGLLLYAPNALALDISATIQDGYTQVVPGDRLYFEVDVKYPENNGRKDLRLTYDIVQNNKTVSEEKVLKAVETQASFIDYIVVPKGANSGLTTLQITIEDYQGLNKNVSASFTVLKGRDAIQSYFFILLGAIGLVMVLVVIQIVYARKLHQAE